MNVDIVGLNRFYDSGLGRQARDRIAMALSSLLLLNGHGRLLGLGYTLPYLDRFRADAEQTIAFMLAKQGVTAWPRHEPSAAALVFDEELPLADSSVDCVLMIHALEFTENPSETLKEIWRVLSPNGRVIITVPNRRGLWARFEHTPFGYGQPYSRGQLSNLLRGTNFTPTAHSEALFCPPSQRTTILQSAAVWERLGQKFWSLFSGVVIMEAQKKLYQGILIPKRNSRRVFVPALPQASSLGRKKELPKGFGRSIIL